jgi:hypothetical protein
VFEGSSEIILHFQNCFVVTGLSLWTVEIISLI